MHLQHTLTSLTLLAALTHAKPFARVRLHARQFTNSSTTVITSSQTSIDTTTIPTTSTTTEPSASCTAITTVTQETNCNQIASAYGIRLTAYEASSPANSSVCQDILEGYGICVSTAGASATTTILNDLASSTSLLQASNSNATFGAVSIFLNTTTTDLSIQTTSALDPSSSSSSSLTPAVFGPAALTTTADLSIQTPSGSESLSSSFPISTPAVFGPASLTTSMLLSETAVETQSTITSLTTTTLTYTLGTASTDVRTLLQVHTVTEVITYTTTVDLSGPETTVYAANSLISPASATATSTSLCTTPLPPGPVQTGVVPGCTNWYIAQQGDFCYHVATKFNLDVTRFQLWNPAVGLDTCSYMLPGHAYCVGTCGNYQGLSSSSAVESSTSSSTISLGVASTLSVTSTTALSFASISISSSSSSTSLTSSSPGITSTTTTSSSSSSSSPSTSTLTSTSSSSSSSSTVSSVESTSTSLTTSSSISSSTSTLSSTTASSSSSTSPSLPSSSTLASTSTSSARTSTITSDVQVQYTTFTGDGSLAAGWPAMSSWIDFDTMFTINTPNMEESCSQWGVPDDTTTELSDMKAAISDIASSTGVDERLILAVIMQESTGCVRVITTSYSVFNPGLMQSHNGTGTCNTNNVPIASGGTGAGVVQTPCPDSEIRQMITDGTNGTSSGDGLKQCLQKQGNTDVSQYYRAARMYNGGSIAASGDLGQGCCTLCYASDIANRLLGWVNAPHNCNL